jgi:hypothetical protein
MGRRLYSLPRRKQQPLKGFPWFDLSRAANDDLPDFGTK